MLLTHTICPRDTGTRREEEREEGIGRKKGEQARLTGSCLDNLNDFSCSICIHASGQDCTCSLACKAAAHVARRDAAPIVENHGSQTSLQHLLQQRCLFIALISIFKSSTFFRTNVFKFEAPVEYSPLIRLNFPLGAL